MTSVEVIIHDNLVKVITNHSKNACLKTRPVDASTLNKPLERIHSAHFLDRSGSMEGQALEEAKRCVAYIIEQLTVKDCPE
jgi:hypothetical protein